MSIRFTFPDKLLPYSIATYRSKAVRLRYESAKCRCSKTLVPGTEHSRQQQPLTHLARFSTRYIKTYKKRRQQNQNFCRFRPRDAPQKFTIKDNFKANFKIFKSPSLSPSISSLFYFIFLSVSFMYAQSQCTRE